MSVNVVLGAGGPTGLECVKRLLKATDAPVRAVVRDPSKYAEVMQQATAESGVPPCMQTEITTFEDGINLTCTRHMYVAPRLLLSWCIPACMHTLHEWTARQCGHSWYSRYSVEGG
jgi:hypothetical protein